MKYVFGNWKAHMSSSEVSQWLNEFKRLYKPSEKVAVAIFPSFIHLTRVATELKGLKQVFVGAQTVCPYEGNGSQTGSVTVNNLVGIVDYLIIAHSEYRAITALTNRDYFVACQEAINNGISPVFCVRGKQDPFPDNLPFIAYEPVDAIGTGKNKTIDEIKQVKESFQIPPTTSFIYGGSVNKDNCRQYAPDPDIDGVLVGTSSLSPGEFNSIISAFQ